MKKAVIIIPTYNEKGNIEKLIDILENSIFPKIDKYDDLVRALQTVLNRATIDRKPVEIDLRFNKPVMRYGT